MRARSTLIDAFGLHDTEPVTEPAAEFARRPGPRLETMRPVTSRLTSRDYTLLEAHLWRLLESDTASPIDRLLARLIRTKLADAAVVLSDDIEPLVATGNSRIRFSIDDRPAESRLLAHWDSQASVDSLLPIPTFAGVTLLGMAAGQRAPLLRADGSIGAVQLVAVTYQPEAARRAVRVGQEKERSHG